MLSLIPLLLVVALGQADAGNKGSLETVQDERPVRARADVSGDPMLVAIPDAPKNLKDWASALSLLQTGYADLRIAADQAEAAALRTSSAIASLFPVIQASVGVYSDVLVKGRAPLISGGGGNISAVPVAGAGPQPSVPLGVGQAYGTMPVVDYHAWNTIFLGRAYEVSAKATYEDTQRRAVGSLAQTLLATVAAERATEIQRINLARALELSVLIERSYKLGARNLLDVERARQNTTVARSDVVNGQETLRRSRESLGLLLGSAGAIGVSPEFNLGGMPQFGRERCQTLQKLDDRADIRSAKAKVDAARANVRDGWSQYLPAISAQTNLIAITVDPGFAQIPTWSIAAVLGLRFAPGTWAETAARAAQERAQETSLSLSERSVAIEVVQATRAVTVANSLLYQGQAARDQAKEIARLTVRSFEVGQGDSFEVVTAEAALRAAELNLVLAEFRLAQARVDAFLSGASCHL